MAHATYDCLTCGACCAAPAEKRHFRIDAGDVERLRRVGLEVVQIPIPQVDPPVLTWALPTKLDANGVRVCVGLSGCAGGGNACSVYEGRIRVGGLSSAAFRAGKRGAVSDCRFDPSECPFWRPSRVQDESGV